MKGTGRGVGVNGETDDFSARYDRLVSGGGSIGWVFKTLAVLLVLLAVVAGLSSALGG